MRAYYAANRDKVLARMRSTRIRSRYGLELHEVAEMHAAQNGRCAICGTEVTLDGTGQPAHIDHDHDTEAVRGILCFQCNSALGLFQDSPGRLMAAAEYLAT